MGHASASPLLPAWLDDHLDRLGFLPNPFFHFSITPCGPVLYFSISVADQRPVVVIIEIC